MAGSRRRRSTSHNAAGRPDTDPAAAKSRLQTPDRHGSPARADTDTTGAQSQDVPQRGHDLSGRPDTEPAECELRDRLRAWRVTANGHEPAWCRPVAQRLADRAIWTRDEKRQAGRILRWYKVTAAPPAESHAESSSNHTPPVQSVTGPHLVLSLFPGIGHLSQVDVYEQALLTLILLKLGTKHRSVTLPDRECQEYCKVKRSHWYEMLDRLKADSLLIVGDLRDGQRCYQVVTQNLVGLLPAEDQRHYYRILDPSGGYDGLIESATRTASPARGRRVHAVDASARALIEHLQSPPPPPPPPPPQSQSTPWTTTQESWEEAEEEVRSLVVDWQKPMAAVRAAGVTPDYVLAVCAYQRASGVYGPGALHARLCRAHPAVPPDRGWPSDPATKPARRIGHRTDIEVAEWLWQTIRKQKTATEAEAIFRAEATRRGIAADVQVKILEGV